MAQMESHSQWTEHSSPFNVMPIELAEIGQRRVEEFVRLQKNLFDKLGETNLHLFEHTQREANFVSEFVAKLAARSITDVLTACKEWIARRFETIAEDGNDLLTNARKLTEAGARLMSSESLMNGGSNP